MYSDLDLFSTIYQFKTVTTNYENHPLILVYFKVRVAEESKGRVVVDNSLSLVVSRSHTLSPHIAQLCHEAKETTFAPEQLMKEYLDTDEDVGVRKNSKRDINSYFSLNENYSGMDFSKETNHLEFSRRLGRKPLTLRAFQLIWKC